MNIEKAILRALRVDEVLGKDCLFSTADREILGGSSLSAELAEEEAYRE